MNCVSYGINLTFTSIYNKKKGTLGKKCFPPFPKTKCLFVTSFCKWATVLIYLHSSVKYQSELRCVIVTVGNSESSSYVFFLSMFWISFMICWIDKMNVIIYLLYSVLFLKPTIIAPPTPKHITIVKSEYDKWRCFTPSLSGLQIYRITVLLSFTLLACIVM